MTTSLSPSLARLGEDLERVCAADVAARPRRVRRVVLVAAVVAGILGGAAAIAADQLSTSDVANSLPAGTAALIGTNPTCTVVTEGVEYHCVLARPPYRKCPTGGARRSRPSTRPGTSTAAAKR